MADYMNIKNKKLINKLLIALIVIPLLLLAVSCGRKSTAAIEEKTGETDIIESPAAESEKDTVKQTGEVSWKLSTPDEQWKDMESPVLVREERKKASVKVYTIDTSIAQEIDGFGGAFNEKGWEALLLLSPEKRDEVIRELFDPEEGAKFNICRVPIGASDFAVSRYTLNETKNDFTMENFSIERDREYLIPYIKAALGYRPDLKIWGSVWTPPTWMKTNGDFDGGSMKDEPRMYEAFVLYLARFVEEYRNEGIDIYMVAVQNEPEIERNYPTCLWTPEQFLVFIRDYMGPLFEERNSGAEIMLGTIQEGNYFTFPYKVLSDAKANGYVSTVGFQWSGLNSVEEIRRYHPDKKIMQTETECGNFNWLPTFDPDFPQNDWEYGVHTWSKIKEYFDEGVNSYMLWNMILDEEGKSIDSVTPWPQNAAVVVDKNTREVIYTPMFYAFKHFTFFVEEGANYVINMSSGVDAVSFLNPGGEIVIVLQNDSSSSKDLSISTGDCWFEAILPAMSWSTFVVPSAE